MKRARNDERKGGRDKSRGVLILASAALLLLLVMLLQLSQR